MEYFDIVDENDNVVSKCSKYELGKDSKKLRFVNIIIFTKDNKILVPKRSSSKKIYPNCYDFSAAGHVNSGENYEDAAYRELKEELNINDVELEEIGYFNPYITNMDTFSKLYRLKYSNIINEYNKDEINDIYYMTAKEIKNLIILEKEKFKDDYIKIIEYMDKKGLL